MLPFSIKWHFDILAHQETTCSCIIFYRGKIYCCYCHKKNLFGYRHCWLNLDIWFNYLHIDIKYHFLKEKVDNKILQLEFTPTTHMWVDMITKCLPEPKHQICVATHGLIGFNELMGEILLISSNHWNTFKWCRRRGSAMTHLNPFWLNNYLGHLTSHDI